MASATFGGVAGGDILPRRFVKQGTTAGVLLQAGAGEPPVGISASGTHTANVAGFDDGKAAVAGENVRTYRETDQVCDIEAGAAFSIGARLKSDASGRGIAVSANNDQYGAVALAAAAAAGDFVPVRIQMGVHGA